MNIVELSPTEIVPYDKNPRAIPERAVDKVAASLKAYGFQQPIVVDKDHVVIVGHTRLKAAIKMGLTKVPVLIADLPPAKAKAYRLADNRTNQESSWIDELLIGELDELKGLDFDLALTGFDDRELQKLLADDAELERAEETPAVPENPVTIEGDVWVLGNHRIICGDSTKVDVVDKLLGSVKPHLMVTDPPYGVQYDANWRNEMDLANGKPYGARAIGKVENDDRADWTEAYALFPGDVAYVWHPPGAKSIEFYNPLKATGLEARMQIIWAKNVAPIGRGNFHVQHEPCWYAVRKKSGSTAQIGKATERRRILREIDKPQKSETGHSTQKPIECMRRPIINNSSPGQAVYEPFSGSGTTIIAAEMTGRHAYAIELSPAYVDVAVTRWEQFTGSTAINEETGASFTDMRAKRVGKDNGSASQDASGKDDKTAETPSRTPSEARRERRVVEAN